MIGDPHCACLKHGPIAPDIIEERAVGRDETEGRYADVDVVRCARCRRLWLRYQYEIEAFSKSSRWAAALIDESTAATITPGAASAAIEAAPWRIVGGSLFGHAGQRVDTPSA